LQRNVSLDRAGIARRFRLRRPAFAHGRNAVTGTQAATGTAHTRLHLHSPI
jgi:hypothetical protein